jgi:hypothetical protein
MSFTGGSCKCIDNTQTASLLGCFPDSYISALGLSLTNSKYYNQLKYVKII